MFSWIEKFRYNWMEAVALGNRAMTRSCTVVRLAKVTAVLLKSYNELKEKAWTSFTIASMQQARGTSWLRGKRCYIKRSGSSSYLSPEMVSTVRAQRYCQLVNGACVCACACVCVCVCVCALACTWPT